ncbi:hypothetical protein PM082_004686 [Marasmius tenuissimus]|nr:hypothetical protein PM082_004686 [Marasmius tenuissimus]
MTVLSQAGVTGVWRRLRGRVMMNAMSGWEYDEGKYPVQKTLVKGPQLWWIPMHYNRVVKICRVPCERDECGRATTTDGIASPPRRVRRGAGMLRRNEWGAHAFEAMREGIDARGYR